MTFIPAPNEHAIAVMALTVFALILFTRERIPLESSSLFVLGAVTVGFEIFPFYIDGEPLHATAFFAGFGHEALVAVCEGRRFGVDPRHCTTKAAELHQAER